MTVLPYLLRQKERDISYPRICQPRAEDTRKTVLLASLLGWEEREKEEASGALLDFFLLSHSSSMKPILFQEHLCNVVSPLQRKHFLNFPGGISTLDLMVTISSETIPRRL